MDNVELHAGLRTQRGSAMARRLRREGRVPAVLYGCDQTPMALSVVLHEVEMVLKRSGGGLNTLLTLKIEKAEPVTAMIKDYQADIFKRRFTHLDFIRVDLQQRIEVAVALHLVGKCEGVKQGGILEHLKHELRIRCLPTQIPPYLEVDITNLLTGQSLHVRDVSSPKGVEMMEAADTTIATVVIPRAEKVVEVAPTAEAIAGAAPTEAAVAGAASAGAASAGAAPAEGQGMAAPAKKGAGTPGTGKSKGK